jgi:type 1 glutamine amidotransferase
MGRRSVAGVLVLAMACAAAPSDVKNSPSGQPPPAGGTTPLRVLAVTATAGFRHDSIPTARQALQSLATASGEFTITFTETLADLTAARYSTIDVLMFVLTSGELALDDGQKAALLAFVNGGGGFIGVHSATDTLYDWADYGRLVGAYFKEHPWTQEATVTVETTTHPATRALGGSFRLMEEYYTFRENPRPNVQVLLSLNAASVGASGDFPLAWAQAIGQGRSFYTALGHFDSTWTDARFQAHVGGAIRWSGKRD